MAKSTAAKKVVIADRRHDVPDFVGPMQPTPPAAAPAPVPATMVVPDPLATGLAAAKAFYATYTGTAPTTSKCDCQVPRLGTARDVAYQLLNALEGQPLPVVLAGLKAAETQWHNNNDRAVKNIAPAGWLRVLGVTVK